MVSRENHIYFIVLFLFLFLFLFGLSPAVADNASPHQTVEKLIDSIRNLKTEGPLSPKEFKTNQNLSYSALALLDLHEVSLKALGKYWDKRTLKEQKGFVGLLSRMFVKTAFPNAGKFFSTLKLVFGETRIKETKALVPLMVIHNEEGEISIDFHLRKNQGQWQVVDVDLDEVSMRNNLRTQVYKIIAKNNYQELIRRIEKKLKKTNG